MIKLTELLGEKATFTSKYDDSPKLKGKQTELPDELQSKLVNEEIPSGSLNRIDKNRSLKVGDVTTFSNGKHKGKKVKIVKDLGKGKFELEFIKEKIAEGYDHEVAMAISSLKSIISSSTQLMSKLGNMERDIPGWIQDHITNAENYIDQAAQGFHELNDNE